MLIHGQFLREDQLDSFKALGVIPSLFPMHTFYWGDWHLELSEGDRVPADAVLGSVDGVRADESLLTGEAVPVGKRVAQPGELAAASNTAAGFPDPPHGRLRTSAEGVPAKTRRERRLVC